ncbi:unnamed protein product [Ranitomeya imitator]|uniref:EGF-like domain-containing protein n=1 Tax=Ranitomeya imitator TaxID=111125 RepID=A0ABN9LQU9_9NEOB|nr:unnamed protein product [Ranitomeya imitator]
MSSQLSLAWSILPLCLACEYTVRCSEVNSTGNEIRVTLSGAGDVTDVVSAGLQNVHEVDYDEYHEDEDLSGYDVDDSIRVQAVVKPANGEVPATKVEKKKADKKKAEKNKNKKKQKTPCQTTHKNFCVHGKCRCLANISEVSCKCHENYFGERCTEQYLRAVYYKPGLMTMYRPEPTAPYEVASSGAAYNI